MEHDKNILSKYFHNPYSLQMSLKAVARCYLHTLRTLVTLSPIIQYLNCQCRIHFEKHAAEKWFSLKAPLLPNLGAGDLLIWARQIY